MSTVLYPDDDSHEPDDASDLEMPDDIDAEFDDSLWDVFLPDGEVEDPLPAPSDFWIDRDEDELN